MGLDPRLLKGIQVMGFKEPTAIQKSCFAPLKEGKDLVGQSLTGSGKTGAFGLPTLDRLTPGGGIQMLVLTPTRELCVQVRDALEEMARFIPINLISIYGGVGYFPQVEGLRTAEVVVATPGRLLDHLARRNLDLNSIKIVILDEADKMFEMGFEKDVAKILSQTPKKRQTIMFSATMPRAAQEIVKSQLVNPIFIQEELHVDRSLLRQTVFRVGREDKFSLLYHLLNRKGSGPALIFCGTKREVDKVAKNLNKLKFPAVAVHGDLRQAKRQQSVTAFKAGKVDVLVATDIAARGLDISHIEHVYNYDVPRQPDDYTHRIGRTARAGKKGEAITLLCDRDFNNFRKITGKGRMEIKEEKAPEFEKIVIKRDYHDDEDSESSYGRRDSRGSGGRRSYGEGRSSGGRSFGGGRSGGSSYGDRSSSGRNSSGKTYNDRYSNASSSGGRSYGNRSSGGRSFGGDSNRSYSRPSESSAPSESSTPSEHSSEKSFAWKDKSESSTGRFSPSRSNGSYNSSRGSSPREYSQRRSSGGDRSSRSNDSGYGRSSSGGSSYGDRRSSGSSSGGRSYGNRSSSGSRDSRSSSHSYSGSREHSSSGPRTHSTDGPKEHSYSKPSGHSSTSAHSPVKKTGFYSKIHDNKAKSDSKPGSTRTYSDSKPSSEKSSSERKPTKEFRGKKKSSFKGKKSFNTKKY